MLLCLFADIGLIRVLEAENLMSAATALRAKNNIPDVLFFLAHPPTVALGSRDSRLDWPEDLLVSPARLRQEGIALTRSVRGGGITYHWCGQLVCYPILALNYQERDLRRYMRRLEQVAILALNRFGVNAQRRRESSAHLGLWFDGQKLVSIGIRVSNWVTSFGFAMNLGGDYSASEYVKPCGLPGVKLTTLEEILGYTPARSLIIQAIRESFVEVFCRNLVEIPDQTMELLNTIGKSINDKCYEPRRDS